MEIRVKYAKYLDRQEKEVARVRSGGQTRIPHDFDYGALPCLRTEEVEKLSEARPETLEAARAISGITPKAVLYVYQVLQRRGGGGGGGGGSGGGEGGEGGEGGGGAAARRRLKQRAALEQKEAREREAGGAPAVVAGEEEGADAHHFMEL